MRNHCYGNKPVTKANQHQHPAIHNAMWPGLVGKGPDSEPFIELETMLDLTAQAEVDGIRFDGVDLFLSLPHTSIDSTDDELKHLADSIARRDLVVGSLVAPVWPPTGGGSAMGSEQERASFLTQVKKACAIGKKLRDIGIRRYGVIRIDSAASPADWAKDPTANTKLIAKTFSEACLIAEDYGERLAAEGEICWGGMHSWKRMVELLEMVNRPKTLGFQADMAHSLLYTLGYNAAEDRLLPEDFDWSKQDVLMDALRKVTHALRPWTIDFHVAQNDGTVSGSGSHDKTGRHCIVGDPKGKMDIVSRRRSLDAQRNRNPDPGLRAHLLGRLHVPQLRHAGAQDLERHTRNPDRRPQRPRLGLRSRRKWTGAPRSAKAYVGRKRRAQPNDRFASKEKGEDTRLMPGTIYRAVDPKEQLFYLVSGYAHSTQPEASKKSTDPSWHPASYHPHQEPSSSHR